MSDVSKLLDAYRDAVLDVERWPNDKPTQLRDVWAAYDAARKAIADRIEALENPGFEQFLALTRQFLTHYPAEVFTGESGDPGALFVVGLRKLLEASGTPERSSN